jgi:uncharacterized protein
MWREIAASTHHNLVFMSERNNRSDESREQEIATFESSVARFASRGPAPVHLWNPEHCGEIGLSIGADGTWYYQNSPIGRKSLMRLFSTILRKDPDGCHYLVTPVEKIRIDVADAPFLAVEMRVEGEGRGQQLQFTTNCEDEVVAGPDHPLHFLRESDGEGLKPYLLVRGALQALVTRALTYDLVELGTCEEVDGEEMFGVWSGGEFFAAAPAGEGMAS